MYLGTYEDTRKALDELFAGKQAYTDDNQVIFGDDDRIRALIHVHKPQRWAVTIFNENGGEKTIEHAVASARP